MFRPGDSIGPYTLMRKLGQGAFGIVWLAEKKSPVLTKTVALKIPHEHEVDLEAVRREASVWEHAAGHPNILPILDADIYDEYVAIVSEYAPDGSLSNWLARHGGKAPDIQTATEMTVGILAGLAHLHSRNIIHRDLKPDNILLSGETPRLADFGIARILRDTNTSTANISGTPKYMAPEAFRGKRSVQTDIWSVGVILYQLLSGSLPYPQTDGPSLIYAVCNDEPRPLSAVTPEPLRDIVSAALRKEPTGRYQSARDMRDALMHFLSIGAIQGTVEVLPFNVEVPDEPEETALQLNRQQMPASQLQKQYWSQFHDQLRRHNSVIRLNRVPADSCATGFLGHPQAELFAIANTVSGEIRAGIRIYNRADIVEGLNSERETFQERIGLLHSDSFSVKWFDPAGYKTVGEVVLTKPHANIRETARWQEYMTWHQQHMELLFEIFEPLVKKYKPSPKPPFSRNELVEMFWQGLDSEFSQKKINLEKVAIGNAGTSWRKQRISRDSFWIVQLDSTKHFVDTGILIPSLCRQFFSELYDKRESIEARLGRTLNWEVRSNGERWICLRRDFDLKQRESWNSVYNWTIESLGAIREAVFPWP